MKKAITLTILLAALTSCSNSDTYEDISTPPETVTPPVTDPSIITYTKDVKSIIDANCIGCHKIGGAASFRPLTTYTEVKAAVQTAQLLDRIQLQNGQQGLMPQTGRMSQANIDLILKWNTDGLKN